MNNRADLEMAMRLQQEEQGDQPQIQPHSQSNQLPVPAPIAQPPQQNVAPRTLEELYQAHQQGVRLTEEQTRQLNAFLSQRGDNGDCKIM